MSAQLDGIRWHSSPKDVKSTWLLVGKPEGKKPPGRSKRR